MTTSLNEASRFRVSPSVYVRAFGDELVLLDFALGEYFGLDEVGATIWRKLEAGDPLGAIADALVERYEVVQEVALTDVLELVTHLQRHSLVIVLP